MSVYMKAARRPPASEPAKSVAEVPPPLQFPLERWSINYELRERRTALANWSSDSHHSSANVVLALDPTPKPNRRSVTKTSPLAEASPSLPASLPLQTLWILRFSAVQSPVAATRKIELAAIEPVLGQRLIVDGEREC
jgi:hypothetical protein